MEAGRNLSTIKLQLGQILAFWECDMILPLYECEVFSEKII